MALTTWCLRRSQIWFPKLRFRKLSQLREGSNGSLWNQVVFHPIVKEALLTNRPVVALETTIVTHGMPYPSNRQTAQDVEDIVRSYSVVPATIGVIDGKIHVGLTGSQMDRLADPNQSKIKISSRDIPVAISKGLSGGTTVSGTVFIAHRVGIPLLITGGIGGVHRDGHISFDISTDLTELGRTPVGVVSAGIKSILDIPRTLELLETLGVTVVTYGTSREFPAFFTPKSGCYVDTCVETTVECAQLLDANISHCSSSSVLIAVPPPVGVASQGNRVEDAIHDALYEAKNQSIVGKEVTPFVLERVNQLTHGDSLQANIALIKNNAHVGSQIAAEFVKLNTPSSTSNSTNKVGVVSSNQATPTFCRPYIVGASIMDIIAQATDTQVEGHRTNPGSIKNSFGGVARNIAEYLSGTGSNPLLISCVGTDFNGDQILYHMKNTLNMDTSGMNVVKDCRTASYCLILTGQGEFHCGVGDMDSINSHLTVDWVKRFPINFNSVSCVCMDGNVSLEVLKYLCDTSHDNNVPIWYEPTCYEKAIKPIQCDVIDKLSYVTPNSVELLSMYNGLMSREEKKKPLSYITDCPREDILIKRVKELSQPLLSNGVRHILVSLSSKGLVYINKDRLLHYPAAPISMLPVSVTSVSGAGDSLTAAMIANMIKKSDCCQTAKMSKDDYELINESIKIGLKAAYNSLRSSNTVGEIVTELNEEWLNIIPKDIKPIDNSN